jgi:ubiquitin-like 1-activating enzyme E1 B
MSELCGARVLLVGAGGIGCELLKNLVCVGASSITVIDLDTIDVSNLNRQFLFKKAHVGLSKASVAKEAVSALRPSCSIQAIHGNIKDFGVEFFHSFDLVMNALDNVDARKFVNRMCLIAGKPLVESGTGGYAGQVRTIKAGTTECFECSPPAAAQKSFPVCTIRNTPDLPIHCIAWAKFVLSALFGPKDEEDNMLRDLSLPEAASPQDVAEAVFAKLFHTDIIAAQQVEDRWKNRPRPVELDLAMVKHKLGVQDPLINQVMTLEQACKIFLDACITILSQRKEDIGSIVFDKDDADLLHFVAGAANLRMHIFGINKLSLFEIKGIAGNIIHAIATTNAIAAGLMVIQAMRAIQGDFQSCKHVWIGRSGPRALNVEDLGTPKPNCFICGTAILKLRTDLGKLTLGDIYNSVLRKGLGLVSASIDIPEKGDRGYLGWEDDQEDSGLLDKVLKDPILSLKTGTILKVSDLDDRISIDICLEHVELDEETSSSKFEIIPLNAESGSIEETLKKHAKSPDQQQQQSPLRKKAKTQPEDGIEVLSD